MSIHPSLRRTTKDKQQRSVLKRIERVKKLMDEEAWEEDKVFKLPKIKTIKMKVKKEKAAEAETVAEGAVGAEGAAPDTKEEAKAGEKSKPEAKDAKKEPKKEGKKEGKK